MRKYLAVICTAICSLTLISWGETGHRAVAKIAANHLSPKAQLAVRNLLGKETLPDISTWADEVRSDPDFKTTWVWHYIDLPAGYSFDEFAKAVKTMPEANVYKMVIRCEYDLKSPATSKATKVAALKYIVHFIGDLHQPMHVSREEDRGGNNIQVKFNGFPTDLHSLWDSGLIDHLNLNYQQMAAKFDDATPVEIKKWQSDDLLIWLWESYQISNILYQEAAADPNFTEDYYQEHLPTLQKRIEKGGIRLAGVLNAIFEK
ncbi:S1/P1 nuclease [Mucilaginibacter paludis]|uniref:S1/P1 nuclease n=1 Tax=Mucilaginibacter paludis DSM 18603 TaxID=714943 RepID=H1YB44_9SPHI|nr:S1/P1 nuclease [Mucilaginibacter paludis]EHQ30570.1 S1/P1 nuclease [Mucilaginibacter paludis DSM 18603]